MKKKTVNINKENIDKVIFDFIYREALNDATNRVLKEGQKKKICDNSKLKNEICKYVNDIITGKNPDFSKTIESIEKMLQKNNIDYFTFGNIQKLLSMTMKYYYIRYYDREEAKYFDCCPAPMDMSMRDKVYKLYKEKTGKAPAFSPETAWSKITSDNPENEKYKTENYYNYQEAIDEIISDEKMNCNKIEFDYRIW